MSWRPVMLGALGAAYFAGAAYLAGLVTERIRVDRERMAVVRAQEQRAREARARAIRIELEQAAGPGLRVRVPNLPASRPRPMRRRQKT